MQSNQKGNRGIIIQPICTLPPTSNLLPVTHNGQGIPLIGVHVGQPPRAQRKLGRAKNGLKRQSEDVTSGQENM